MRGVLHAPHRRRRPSNLIVTQANHLTVFAIRRESSTATDAQLGARAVARAKQTASADAGVGADVEVSLEVVAEFDLHGTVGSLCALRRRFGAPRNQRDALCVAVRENKLSVVEFDPATQSLVNSSLHSWETPTGAGACPARTESRRCLRSRLPTPRAAAPPCSCAGEGGSRLALLPAVEGESFGGEEEADASDASDADDAEDDTDARRASTTTVGGDVRARGTAASVKDSYVLDLAREMKISGARDVVFLHGYGEPTILVLHEKKPTWAGRLALVADTCAVSAITLDLDNKRHAVIWRRDACRTRATGYAPCPSRSAARLCCRRTSSCTRARRARARSRSTPWRAGTRAGTTPPRPRTKPRRRRRWRRRRGTPPRKTLRWRIRPPRWRRARARRALWAFPWRWTPRTPRSFPKNAFCSPRSKAL